MNFRGQVISWLALVAVWSVASGAAAQVTVSGFVQNGSSMGVANALLEFKQGASVVGSDTSAVNGSYSVSLPAGTYSLSVTPPVSSNFAAQTQSGLMFTQSSTLNVVLIAAGAGSTPYTGVLLSRSGAGVADHDVRLADDDDIFVDTTDSSGAFSVSASNALHSVEVRCSYCQNDNEYYTVYFPNVDLSGGPVSGVSLTLQDRVLTGTVRDSLNAPVANAAVYWRQDVEYQGGVVTGFSENYFETNAQGQFTIRVFPGSGMLDITPPSGLGLNQKVVVVSVPDVSGDPATVNVVLDAATAYSGAVRDRNAMGLADHDVRLDDGDFIYTDTTDVNGAFSVGASDAMQSVEVRCSYCRGGNEYYTVSFADIDLSSGPITGATLTLQDRALTGTVRDSLNAPVVGADVYWQQEVDYASGGVTGFSEDFAETNAQGQFTLLVMPGSGTLDITPPNAAGLNPKVVDVTVPDVTTDPTPVTVVLDAGTTYSGVLRDRSGTGVIDHQIRLDDGNFNYTDTTEANGAFSVSASDAVQSVQVRCSYCLGGNEYYTVDFPDVDLSSGAVSGAMLTLEDRALTGTVTDADDKPITAVDLYWTQEISYQGGLVTGFGEDFAATNDQGQFAVHVFPGTGSFEATPPPSTGLAPFSIDNVAIVGDQSLAILVQFVSEAISTSVGAGGTVTSDPENDGATEDDPIETSVTVPAGGTVTISERPISLLPPSGFNFLTQEISITAPTASVGAPLVITFVLDASRVPVGIDETTLQVFRTGTLVPACTGSAGQATPNPCVSERTLLVDDDIEVVVLTSMASIWNLGVSEAGADCGNSTMEVGETCDDGNLLNGDCCSAACQLDVDRAACEEGDLCTTSDTCDGAGTCEPGNAVTCTAQSDCHEVGTCNSATGQCSTPVKAAGESCGSASDTVCTDPDTCDGAGVCQSHDAANCCTSDADCDDADECTSDSCDANACLHASVAGCGMSTNGDDDAGQDGPPSDGGAANDSDAMVADNDAGSAPVGGDRDAGDADGGAADGGTPSGEDSGCQCTIEQRDGSAPSALLWFGLAVALRLVQRRRRKAR